MKKLQRICSNGGADELPFRSVGSDVITWVRARIVAPEVITVGDSFIIDDFVLVTGGGETLIGSFVNIATFFSVVGVGGLLMEDLPACQGDVAWTLAMRNISGGL